MTAFPTPTGPAARVLAMPYAQRRRIMVVDDAALADPSKLPGHQGVIDKAFGVVGKARAGYWNFTQKYYKAVFGNTIGGVMAKVVKPFIGGGDASADSELKFVPVGRSEAAGLKFPLGHPLDGVLYVGHPALPEVYYPAATFHRFTFEHKFAEAVRLLMCLGARQIEVEHEAGWSREFSSRIAFPVAAAGVQVGLSGGGSQSSNSRALFAAAPVAPTQPPRVPEDVVWYPHEPTWQQIAEGRIRHGLQDFSLAVKYENDFGVNGGLKVAAGNAGIDLGGKFEDHQLTVWRIAGNFDAAPH